MLMDAREADGCLLDAREADCAGLCARCVGFTVRRPKRHGVDNGGTTAGWSRRRRNNLSMRAILGAGIVVLVTAALFYHLGQWQARGTLPPQLAEPQTSIIANERNGQPTRQTQQQQPSVAATVTHSKHFRSQPQPAVPATLPSADLNRHDEAVGTPPSPPPEETASPPPEETASPPPEETAAFIDPFSLMRGCHCLTTQADTAERHAQLESLLAKTPSVAWTSLDASRHSLLNMAAFYGDLPAVRSLIKAGADVSHQDVLRHTPLHHVTDCKDCSEDVGANITSVLLASGADPTVKDSRKRLASSLAARRGWKQVVRMHLQAIEKKSHLLIDRPPPHPPLPPKLYPPSPPRPPPPRPWAPINAHRWEEGKGWTCISHCDETPPCNATVHPLRAQYDATGFVVLQEMLSPATVDVMAASVNEYVARRGPLLTDRDPYHTHPGYLIAGMNREMALTSLFETFHGSRKLRAALELLFDSPQHRSQQDVTSIRSPKTWLLPSYRQISRTELSIDRARDWHRDGCAFNPHFGNQEVLAKTLLNAATYFQDSGNTPSLEIKHFGVRRCGGSTLERPTVYQLHPRKGGTRRRLIPPSVLLSAFRSHSPLAPSTSHPKML